MTMESDIATRLERTLEKLQSRVREQEDILEKVCLDSLITCPLI